MEVDETALFHIRMCILDFQMVIEVLVHVGCYTACD